MRRIAALPCLVLLALGAAACGDEATEATELVDGCEVAVDRAPSAGECTLVDWDVVALAGSSVDLEYLANDPGCSLGLDRVQVDETDDAVTLRVVVGYRGDDGACPTSIGTHATTVVLAAPLGDRRLLGCRPDGSFAPAGGYDSPEPRDPDIDCATNR